MMMPITPQQETIDLEAITEDLKNCSQQLLAIQARLLSLQQRIDGMHRKDKLLPKADVK